jgi:hypothetical protein
VQWPPRHDRADRRSSQWGWSTIICQLATHTRFHILAERLPKNTILKLVNFKSLVENWLKTSQKISQKLHKKAFGKQICRSSVNQLFSKRDIYFIKCG